MKARSESLGVVTADPAATMPVGGVVHIQSVPITYEGKNSPAWLEDWGSFQGILLSMCFSDPETHRIEGSAVLVAPGIAICARHVVDSVLPQIMTGEQAITCFGITPVGLRIWRVRKLTQVGESDLAILGLELASQFSSRETLYISRMTTRLPMEGESLLICGFKAASMTFPRDSTQFAGQVLVSRGKVTARYATGRDRVMMPWPCLEISCASWGGMSGGPVYDRKGLLVGVLSTSVEEKGLVGPSYVSLIWPALAADFEGGWPSPLFQKPTKLVNLDARLCAIDRRESIKVTADPKSGDPTTEYHVWEQ